MLNSSRINNSPRTNNTNLYNNINETANGLSRTFIQPSITSTPLVKRESIFATPPKHSILSPRRYSLSEIATPPRSNRRDLTKVVSTGPLLTNTKYNINVSTYEDTKSPGLASRIVQYNEEAEREKEYSRPPTHQAKYGSPGLFPVVHLFKKKLPVLEQKPKRVTIRIASPDYSRHHSQEYNRKLLEGIIKPSSPPNKGSSFSPSTQSNSSTRSVLDALKEISRKRIHTNEEYDLHEESGKRLRTMDNEESNKRYRVDSPLDESSSPSKPTSKRVCMYDEYAASCSSMNFSFKKMEDPGPKRKSISISTLTDNPKESKQVKLINAETQTVTSERVEVVEPILENGQDPTEVAEESLEREKSPLKIFDDAPLERIRKNRLAALMGSLTGKEPVLLPKPDYAVMLDSQEDKTHTPDLSSSEARKSTEKTLVSILSTPNKSSPTKSNKHVHFSTPESCSLINPTSTAAIVSFSVASSVTDVSSSADDTNRTFTSRSTPAPPSSPIGVQANSNDSTTVLPITSFGTESGSNASSTTSVVSKESSSSLVQLESSNKGIIIPSFQFTPASSATTVPASSSDTTDSVPTIQLTLSTAPMSTSSITSAVSTIPPKMGGFKFDLSKPVTSSVGSVAPTFSFGSTQSTANKVTSSDSATVAPYSANTQSNTFNFGAKPAVPATTTSANTSAGLSFGTTTTNSTSSFGISTSSVSPAPMFKFGPVSESKPTGFPLAQSNATTFGVSSSTTSAPAFGSTTSTAVSATTTTSAPAFGTSKAPFFTFGPSKTTAAPSGFGAPASTTSSSITFGAPSTTQSSFGTATNNFLNTSTSLTTPAFGITTTSSTSSGGFGSPAATTNVGFHSNTTPMFGVNKPASPFAANTTSAPAFGSSSITNSSPFGKNSTPQIGQNTTQSTFGTPTTTLSFGTTNSFGNTTTTTSSSVFGGANSSSVFGAKSGGFGAPSTNSNIFGGPVNSQPSGFGSSPAKPIFGAALNLSFGSTTSTTTTPSFGNTTTTPSFGNTMTPSFNFTAKTTANSSFGNTNSFGTTTTAATGFGNTTTPSFSTSNSFGGNTFGSSNAFVPSNTPVFGAATTNSQPSGFGVTTTPSFGSGNTNFNASNKNSGFGNATVFGNPNSAPFGSSNATPSFGTSNNTAGFSNSTGISAFAKPQVTQNTFGAPASNTFQANSTFGGPQQQTPSFGSANPSTNQNAVFSFGATTPPKPPGVFSFGAGASNEVPKPTFNFTGGITAPPAFGTTGSSTFGNSGPPPQFGASGITQFNAPQPVPQGMFSIGSGSSTGKSRTHLKPKRRT